MNKEAYDKECEGLTARQKIFNTTHAEYTEAQNETKDIDYKIAQGEENDRLRERSKEVSKKVEAHNEEIKNLEARKIEIMKTGDALVEG
jgi:hypothetical protein